MTVTDHELRDEVLHKISTNRLRDELYQRGKSTTPCHVCHAQTMQCCSDCAINFGAKVYVCQKPTCRAEHERKCYGCKPSWVLAG